MPLAGVGPEWGTCSPPLRNLLLSPALLRALLEQPIAQNGRHLAQLHASIGREAWMRCSPQTQPLKFLPSVILLPCAQQGPWGLGEHLEGRGDRHRYPDRSREGRVPNSWWTSRQERAVTTKTKEPAGQEAEGPGK